ncbi:LysM peptidoglycan-binding domain-containing protein [Thermodesulfobacteriota bacterium]
MDPNSDIEMEEIREMAENMGLERKRKTIELPSRLVIGAIVVICVLFVFALFFRGGGNADTEQINAIMGRLDKLEEKLPQYAEIEKKTGKLESQIKTVQKAGSKSDANYRSLTREISKINKQMGLLNEEVSSLSKKISTSGFDQKKKSSRAKGSHHEVQRGETLFGIAKKYGLSVDELRDMNKLSKDKSIYPGQKLLIR